MKGETLLPDVRECNRCGRPFQYCGFGPSVCGACKSIDELEFGKVRDFLNEHGNATMYEISDATGVTEKTVRRYLTESRLEIPENSPIFIKCSVCGCDIRSGKYCPDCAAKLSKDLNDVYKSFVGDKPKDLSNAIRGKMHHYGKDDE